MKLFVQSPTAVTLIVLPTSVPQTTASSLNLLLNPNPANAMLTIETGNLPFDEYRLIISDVTGRSNFSKSIAETSTKHNLDISSLSKGIYFVQIQAGDRNSRVRFVKN